MADYGYAASLYQDGDILVLLGTNKAFTDADVIVNTTSDGVGDIAHQRTVDTKQGYHQKFTYKQVSDIDDLQDISMTDFLTPEGYEKLKGYYDNRTDIYFGKYDVKAKKMLECVDGKITQFASHTVHGDYTATYTISPNSNIKDATFTASKA